MSDGNSLWEKYKNFLNTEVHLLPRRDSAAEKEVKEDQPKLKPREEAVEKADKKVGWKAKSGTDRYLAKWRRFIPSKKQTALGLAVFVAVIIAFSGGYFVVNWYLNANASGSGVTSYEQDDYGDWNTYQNKTHHFEIRYPADWGVKEIKTGRIRFKPIKPEESKTALKDYIFVKVASSKGRAQTTCEKNYKKCSFYTNGIFGERSTTPETDEIFFGHGSKDFTITLYKFDADEETTEGYIETFEKLAGSFRFLGEATKACKATDDCVLAVRIDKCCSCFEVVSQTELKANSSLVAWEAGKDYSGQKLLDCESVYCSDCPEPSPFGVECVEDQCCVK